MVYQNNFEHVFCLLKMIFQCILQVKLKGLALVPSAVRAGSAGGAWLLNVLLCGMKPSFGL